MPVRQGEKAVNKRFFVTFLLFIIDFNHENGQFTSALSSRRIEFPSSINLFFANPFPRKRFFMSLKPVQAFACCLLALAFSAPAFAAGDTIKLGVAGAHSGELSSYGVPTLNAAHLVVDQYNAKGGVMGKQIEIIAEDDQCKPEIAPNAATKLISDGVNVVLGHICSGATKAAQPLYNNAKIVAMSPSATTPSMTESRENPYFFRTVAKDNDSSTVSAKFAVEGLKSKKVAILHDNSEYGKGYADGCAAYLKEAGVEVVLFEAVTPGAAD